MERESHPKLIAALCLLLVLIFAGYQVLRYVELLKYKSVSEDKSHTGISQPPSLKFDGKTHYYNSDIKTIALLGIDEEALKEKSEYQQAGQSDVIVLLSVNTKTKQFFLLPVDRDTMTDVMEYGPFGSQLGIVKEQITLAYGFGNGGIISGENTIKSLKVLLHNIPIAGYFASPIPVVSTVNDAVGGVTVKIEDDFSKVDPSLVMGKTITLKGAQAEHYVRGRKNVSAGTNESRMKRQEIYYTALIKKLKKLSQDEAFSLYYNVSDCTKTNLGATDLSYYISLLSSCTYKGTYHISGNEVQGKEFMEFYPSSSELKSLLTQLYFTA